MNEMSAPVFVSGFQWRQFQQRLKQDNYPKWACDLSDAHLEGLLWLAGEFSARGFCLLELFDSDPLVLVGSHTGARIAKSQLECLERSCRGDHFDASEAGRRFTGVSADGGRIQLACELGGAPIFSGTFRESLNIGKYTRWASDLSEASLQHLFWLLGAIATETLPMLKPASEYVDLTPWPDFNALRPRFGLEGIWRVVVQGERFDVDRVCDFIEKGERQFHRECLRAVPFSVRRTVEKVAPRATWKRLERVDKLEKEYRFAGEDERGCDSWVTVRHDDGRVEVGTVVSEEEVPGSVLAAFKAQLPESRAIDRIQAIGPDRQTVDRYRTYVTPRPGQSRLIVVSAAGTKIEVMES
jgi:hypothetical protein